MLKKISLSVLGLAFLVSCSQYSNAPMSKAWHNTNAHYNAYLMAAEDLKQAKIAILANRQENYAQTLPIFLPIDSTQNLEIKPLLTDAIRKASIVAERHQNAKWLDDAYLLIGEARLLKQDFLNAIEVFKFVNTKTTNLKQKHAALILLMRAYIEQDDDEGVLRVAELLRSQDLSRENSINFYLTKAYFHQRKQEYALCTGILEEALKLMKRKEETARVHYIAGQLYDAQKQTQKAFAHYQEAERNRPSYDLSFYAQMNALLNQAGTNKGSLTEVKKYFDEMLKDRKNSDLQDKIYLTMGRLEVQQKDFAKALSYFQKSAKKAQTGSNQAAFAYLESAQLYYDKFQNYSLAQAYYDSALAVLPPKHAEYNNIKKRQKTLSDFVKYYTIAKTEDSLQALLQLSPADLDKQLTKIIKDQDEQEQKLMGIAKRIAAKEAQKGVLASNTERWVLYDPAAIQRGKTTFNQIWGGRPLEDNWRRGTKQGGDIALKADEKKTETSSTDQASLTPSKKSIGERKKELLASLPITPEALEGSKKKQEIAYYQVGKIYQLQLNEVDLAKKYFEKLLGQFPKTIYEPEVLYLLALHTPEPHKQQLVSKYPLSSFARLIQKGITNTGGDAELQAQHLYASTYKMYENANYTTALQRLEEGMSEFAGVKIEDKMALLRILLLAKNNQKDAYLQALNDFGQSYPNSNLLPTVKEMVRVVGR